MEMSLRKVFRSRPKDETLQILAKKEVLLCAGNLNPSQLLELSGIGNADFLQNHAIPVVINNPAVGENLQAHPSPASASDSQVPGDIARDPNIVQALLKLYAETNGVHWQGCPSAWPTSDCQWIRRCTN